MYLVSNVANYGMEVGSFIINDDYLDYYNQLTVDYETSLEVYSHAYDPERDGLLSPKEFIEIADEIIEEEKRMKAKDRIYTHREKLSKSPKGCSFLAPKKKNIKLDIGCQCRGRCLGCYAEETFRIHHSNFILKEFELLVRKGKNKTNSLYHFSKPYLNPVEVPTPFIHKLVSFMSPTMTKKNKSNGLADVFLFNISDISFYNPEIVKYFLEKVLIETDRIIVLLSKGPSYYTYLLPLLKKYKHRIRIGCSVSTELQVLLGLKVMGDLFDDSFNTFISLSPMTDTITESTFLKLAESNIKDILIGGFSDKEHLAFPVSETNLNYIIRLREEYNKCINIDEQFGVFLPKDFKYNNVDWIKHGFNHSNPDLKEKQIIKATKHEIENSRERLQGRLDKAINADDSTFTINICGSDKLKFKRICYLYNKGINFDNVDFKFKIGEDKYLFMDVKQLIEGGYVHGRKKRLADRKAS